ncbi:transposable element Tcb2 transposase [Trichonephila clavipes]|nr:transposable element Tcb2 transposase [Trichonephila clavipes]
MLNSIYKGRAEVDWPIRHFPRQYEQLSQFEWGRIIGVMEAGWSSRRVPRHLGRSYCVPTASSATIQTQVAPSLGAPVSSRTKRRHLAEGHLGSRRPLRVLPLTPTHRRLHLECSDDNRVHVWRPRGERLNTAFALQRHTAPTAGVMLWVAIAYNTRSPLVLIRGTMTAQRYVHGILQPHVLPLIEHIYDYFRRRVGHPTSLNEPAARLQQIWNAMSQDIIQNLYASMPDPIASCICARVCSIGY